MHYRCSLRRLRLQPPPPTVAASAAYGCSLRRLRLQASALGDAVRSLTKSQGEAEKLRGKLKMSVEDLAAAHHELRSAGGREWGVGSMGSRE